ncbi:MAG: PBP1A family penicillin-binding protein [Candidatus Cloacimonetes bacterium]|nr:PBP1A family penicillin-binding protein [Candidatus Cloacimonadota bacterium]
MEENKKQKIMVIREGKIVDEEIITDYPTDSRSGSLFWSVTIRWLLILLGVGALFFGIIFGVLNYYNSELPPLSELTHYDMKIGSEVYDCNGKLIHVFASEYRQLTDVTQLPQHVLDALVATEDSKFYSHWGIDQRAVFRAVLINLRKLSYAQGFSTITQQLARNMFLTLDKHLSRKLKEILLAVQIERMYSKDEILEMYFNKVSFGPGIYGIESASQIYYGKEAKELTITEGALIVGITQYPSAYYPLRHPERALWRRNQVLNRMLTVKCISRETYEETIQEPLNLITTSRDRNAKDYFLEHIRLYLEKKYGTQRLFAGGLRIETTLDWELQQFADSVLNAHLTDLEKKKNYQSKYADVLPEATDIVTSYVQGSVLVMDPHTGYVRVMIGGRNFRHSKFNRITQARRQPGSAFKPIVYTTALEKGYTPATIIRDIPTFFVESDTVFWKPHNYSRRHFGYTRIREGLFKSRNVVAVKVITDIGAKEVVKTARRFGITTSMMPVYSLAVGTEVVKPIQIMSAYTAFPNSGKRTTPLFIQRVLDQDGDILEQAQIEQIRVIDEKIAYLMVSMMQSVVEEGTAAGMRWMGYPWPAAGKTGTTDDYRDAWFIGYNKQLLCGIWVGFDDNSTLKTKVSGATAALPPWPCIMRHALEKDAPKNRKGKPVIDGSILQFNKPDGIVSVKISKRTGLLPKNSLESVMVEYFVEGTEPTPLSDSLSYNFYPTIYRNTSKDSLVFDLGGKDEDSLKLDLRGADIIKL